MIEQGIVAFVNGGLSSPPSTIGGFNGQLPKDRALPSWTYLVISGQPQTALQSPSGFWKMRLQIDCFGNTGAEKLTLANSIRSILNGFRGTLPDPDSTYVDSCFLSDEMDFTLDEYGRSHRRMLEFEIFYSQN